MTNKKTKRDDFLTTNATIAHNRRARFDYHIQDEFEAGIVLTGTEVKSLRKGQASLNESYVKEQNGEIFLLNATIQEYGHAGRHLQHAPARPRKLLLNKREITRLIGAVQKQGLTIIPLKLFFDARGMVKITIALAKGKKLHDKRETTKTRDWNRQKARLMKD